MSYSDTYTSDAYNPFIEESQTDFVGASVVSICRPKFIYFKAVGMRPNSRHFAFIDQTNVSNYINTSAGTISDFKNLARNDVKRNPGEKYVNETGFPTELGGPSAAIYSDSLGTIEGVLYLQSNSTLNFPTGTRTLTFIDISVLDEDAALSVAHGSYLALGTTELYETTYYNVPNPNPPSEPPAYDPPSNEGGNGDPPKPYQGPITHPGPGGPKENITGEGAQLPSNGWEPYNNNQHDPGDEKGGGGKIVCTAMNEAYGFGSFRQKIWLAQSRGLPEEYQIGYHALFLPLVNYAYKTNKPGHRAVRATLEHIARHRTADIWMQKRGRRDKIGAVERAVLEPLCYVTGWVIKKVRMDR